jgi:uncharacterized membrane protein HdeD (DUF308 family)
MATIAQDSMTGFLTDRATQARKNWGWFLALGTIQIIVGMVAVSFSFSATIASVVTLGVLLLIAGGAQVVAAIFAGDWGGFFLFLLLGILYTVNGFLALENPLFAAEGLTLMLAAGNMAGGTFRIIVSLFERFPSWGWVFFNGIITVSLGTAIWKQWPQSGLWVLGLFVGIDLIVNGVTWSALAITVRNDLAKLTGRISAAAR